LREHLGIEGNEDREARIDAYSLDFEVAQLVYDLRTEAGLTQAQLAERIGTQASAISRLEDADYEGHSVSMMRRIARALGKRVVLGVVKDDQAEQREPVAA
jgi:transcriptional regulator with XRE-family HTH domain